MFKCWARNIDFAYLIIGIAFHQLAALQYELAIFERSANSYTCAVVCPTSSTAGLYSLQNSRRMHPGKRSLKGKAAKACPENATGGGGGGGDDMHASPNTQPCRRKYKSQLGVCWSQHDAGWYMFCVMYKVA